jgi:hypothetical protein
MRDVILSALFGIVHYLERTVHFYGVIRHRRGRMGIAILAHRKRIGKSRA